MWKLCSIMFVILLMIVGCSKSGTVIPSDAVNVDDYETGDSLGYKIEHFIKEDIFKAYPELEKQYPSDLSKENYLKSEEAKNLLKMMKNDLNKMLQKTYKINLNRSLGTYDTKEKAFIIGYNSLPCGDSDLEQSREEAMRESSNSSDGFWFDDVPFRVYKETGYLLGSRYCILHHELVLHFDKEVASQLESTSNQVYLVFNPKDSLKNNYVETKDVALVVVNNSTKKTLYAVKFSNFDEKTTWRKKNNLLQEKQLSTSNIQQPPTGAQNIQPLIELGNTMKDSEKFQEAIDAYQKALELNPNNDEVLVDLGTCYGRIKMHDMAIDSYKKAISINPNNYRGHWNIGITLLFIKGDDKEGRKEVEEAIRIVSNMPDTNKSKEILADLNEKLESVKAKMEQQSSSSSPAFNEEFLGIKYVMAVEAGSLYCYVDDSWTSISNNIKKDFLKQIGNKKYFGKKQFTVRNSKGERVAEYRSGNIKLF